MWKYTSTNHNSSCDELWPKLCNNVSPNISPIKLNPLPNPPKSQKSTFIKLYGPPDPPPIHSISTVHLQHQITKQQYHKPISIPIDIVKEGRSLWSACQPRFSPTCTRLLKPSWIGEIERLGLDSVRRGQWRVRDEGVGRDLGRWWESHDVIWRLRRFVKSNSGVFGFEIQVLFGLMCLVQEVLLVFFQPCDYEDWLCRWRIKFGRRPLTGGRYFCTIFVNEY